MRATRLIARVAVVIGIAAAMQAGASATAGAATMIESTPGSALVTPLPLRAT